MPQNTAQVFLPLLTSIALCECFRWARGPQRLGVRLFLLPASRPESPLRQLLQWRERALLGLGQEGSSAGTCRPSGQRLVRSLSPHVIVSFLVFLCCHDSGEKADWGTGFALLCYTMMPPSRAFWKQLSRLGRRALLIISFKLCPQGVISLWFGRKKEKPQTARVAEGFQNFLSQKPWRWMDCVSFSLFFSF